MSMGYCLLGWLIICSGAYLPAVEAQPVSGPHETFDILVVNGLVYDGTGEEPRSANVGIRGGAIAAVDVSAAATAAVVIDAAGMLVTPGFIDPHTHALGDLLSKTKRMNANYLTQGVTTVFVGNDGGGVPNRRETLALLDKQGIGTNVAFFAGHNQIRHEAMGVQHGFPRLSSSTQCVGTSRRK